MSNLALLHATHKKHKKRINKNDNTRLTARSVYNNNFSALTLYTSPPNHAKLFDKEKQKHKQKNKDIDWGEPKRERERTSNSDVLLRVTRVLRVLFFPARQVVAVCALVLETSFWYGTRSATNRNLYFYSSFGFVLRCGFVCWVFVSPLSNGRILPSVFCLVLSFSAPRVECLNLFAIG